MALADQAPHHSELCSYIQQELLITSKYWAKLKPDARNFIQVSRVMAGTQVLGPPFATSKCIIRKLEQKQRYNFRDLYMFLRSKKNEYISSVGVI